MAFLFSIQDFEGTVSSTYDQPVLQILVDIFGESGALVLFSLIMSKLATWHSVIHVSGLSREAYILTSPLSLRLALRPL